MSKAKRTANAWYATVVIATLILAALCAACGPSDAEIVRELRRPRVDTIYVHRTDTLVRVLPDGTTTGTP